MKKKIAFVVYYNKKNRHSFNALVGALQTNSIFNDIDVHSMRTEEEFLTSLQNIIKNYDNIIIGFSLFTSQLWEIHSLIAKMKNKYRNIYAKNIIFIAGGPHPTGDPKNTLKSGFFDVVFVGEGEETLIEFMQKVRNNKDYKDIKGIAYIDDNDKYNYTGKRTPINLNKYPPFPIKNYNFGPIEITRGCPYVCYFCQTSYIMGTSPRYRNIESICKYVRILKEQNLTDIRFITPNAFSYGSEDGKTLNIPILEELLIKIKEIVGPNGRIFLGSFPSEVRPEHVTEETLGLVLKYADNDNIIIGAQTGSQRILDMCNRGHTVEEVYKAVELTINAKLKANVDFIFGLPHENEKDILLTINVMKELVKKGARIHMHSFIPLPQTPFAMEPVSKINNSIQEAIKELISKGSAFGEWKKQEKLAIKIAKYFRDSRE